MKLDFESALAGMPVVAILRGVRPAKAVSIGEALYRAGIRIMEVPLNSPEPLLSIRSLSSQFGESCVIGAGTVLDAGEVDRVADAGGRLIASPNTDASVIERTLAAGLVSLPGIATATDAFSAYRSGARRLKLFPASTYGILHLKALLAVLPPDASVIAVGGVGAREAAEWLSAGARGVGMGSELYRAGDSPAAVFAKARAVVELVNQEKSA